MKFIVVIPVRNEASNLAAVVADVREHCAGVDILIVDDASTDATSAVLATLPVRSLRLPVHLGVGGAIRAGLRYAHRLGYRTVVRMDGDGQHRADQIDDLLQPIRSDATDVAHGSRYSGIESYASRGVRRLSQRLLALGLSALVHRTVTDATSGFWAFGPRAVEFLAHHHPTGYPEPELLLLLRRNGFAVHEVPVRMRDRLSGRSSLTGRRSALAFARVMLAMVIVPLRAIAKVPALE